MKKYIIYTILLFFSNQVFATPLEDHGFLDIITNQSTIEYKLASSNIADTTITIEPLNNETPVRKSFSILGITTIEAGYRQFELKVEGSDFHINKKNKSLTGDTWEIESSTVLNLDSLLSDNKISIRYPSDPNWYISVIITSDNNMIISKFIISGQNPIDAAGLKKYITIAQ